MRERGGGGGGGEERGGDSQWQSASQLYDIFVSHMQGKSTDGCSGPWVSTSGCKAHEGVRASVN